MKRTTSHRLITGIVLVLLVGSGGLFGCGKKDKTTTTTTTTASTATFCERAGKLFIAPPSLDPNAITTPAGLAAGKATLTSFLTDVRSTANVAPVAVKSILSGYADSLAPITSQIDSAKDAAALETALGNILKFLAQKDTAASQKTLATYFQANCR